MARTNQNKGSACLLRMLSCMLFCLSITGPAWAQMIIGESRAVDGKESPHPYLPAPAGGGGGGIVWFDHIAHAGSTFIKVRFEAFDLATDDFVIVRDPDSRDVHRYDASMNGRSFWSASVLSDVVFIELHSVSDHGAQGVRIGGYAQGNLPGWGSNAAEQRGGVAGIDCPYFSLCGANVECSPDWSAPLGMPCHPALPEKVCVYPGPGDEAYAQRRAVCAVIHVDCPDNDPNTPEFSYYCSGYQIDGNGCFVMTNKHCQPPPFCGGWGDGGAECWFNAEATACVMAGIKPIDRYLVVDEVCCSACKNDSPLCLSCNRPPNAPPDPFLDYSLLQTEPIGDAPACGFYGQAVLSTETPVVGEPVYRFHHSHGCQKIYSEGMITEEDDLWPDYFIYDAIGASGSSGSPVFSTLDNTVIIHHGYVGSGQDIIGCTHGKGSAMAAVVEDLIGQGCLPPGATPCPWDLDGNGSVGPGDLAIMLGHWADPHGPENLAQLLGFWGPCK